MIKTIAREIREFKLVSILTPLCMIGEVIFEMLIPLLMASIIDKGVNAGDQVHIFKIGGLMVLAACGCLLCGVLGGKFGAEASAGLARNLRKTMYERIQTYSFSNIDRFSAPSLITRMTTDVTNIQNAFQMILRMCTRAPFSLICAMTMAFLINARLARIYLAAVIFLGGFLAFIVPRASGYFEKTFKMYDEMNASVEENVSAIRVVKAFVQEDTEKKKFSKASYNVYMNFVKAERLVVTNMPVMQLTVYTCIMLISWFGANMIVSDELTTGELMSLLTYCMNILVSLMMLSIVFVMITMSMASVKRIAEVLNEVPEIVNPETPDMDVPDGSIRFDHVNFSYKKGSGEFVLQDIDLSIASGETVGILGSTGSSKSSLINLIPRLYDATEGAVYVGGKDVRTYDLETLRNNVAVVLQQNVLFSGTILNNLKWGNKDATDEECIAACKAACADEFIRQFPEGYDTFIEQGGTNVSGGQRQRLCIARALLKSPKILILDDSTSAVDTTTDARIRKAFREMIPGTTKLIIAQRVSSVMDADRIIVMDNGRIHGFGTHEELLENNEIYRDVFESQTAGSGDFDIAGGED